MAHTDAMDASASPPSSVAHHWDALYRGSLPEERPWYEASPSRSLEAVVDVAAWVDSPIVDVGGGDARLVDLLIERGYRNITLVDIAGTGLQIARTRLGAAASAVDWVQDDVGAPFEAGTALPWARAPFAVWHDRAVFHFLTSSASQQAYLSRVRASVAHGGHVILSAFDASGPETCSGLPVVRRSLEALSHILSEDFDLVSAGRFRHRTPAGVEQPFVCCSWQRVA